MDHYHVHGDWSYIFFIVPSCLSFAMSSSLLLLFYFKQSWRKEFWDFFAVHCIIDLIMNASWFPGPRYHTEGPLCKAQEYVFQVTTLAKSVLGCVVCATLWYIIEGRRDTERVKRLSICLAVFISVCFVFAIAFDSALVTCPFDRKMLYVNNEDNSPEYETALVAFFVTYVAPHIVLFFLSFFFVFQTLRLIHIKSLSMIPLIRDIGLVVVAVPLFIVVLMAPLLIFMLIVVFHGHSTRVLLQLGGAAVSSMGLIIGAFYMFMHYFSPLNARVKYASEKTFVSTERSINPLIDQASAVNHTELGRIPRSSFVTTVIEPLSYDTSPSLK
jgi:hypothetical protein